MIQDLFSRGLDVLWLLIQDFRVISKRRESAANSQIDTLQWKRIPCPHMAGGLIDPGAEHITSSAVDKIETVID
jgi:hypothetical protein